MPEGDNSTDILDCMNSTTDVGKFQRCKNSKEGNACMLTTTGIMAWYLLNSLEGSNTIAVFLNYYNSNLIQRYLERHITKDHVLWTWQSMLESVLIMYQRKKQYTVVPAFVTLVAAMKIQIHCHPRRSLKSYTTLAQVWKSNFLINFNENLL